MHPEKQDIEAALKDWLPGDHGKLVYFPNPGNAGDALIAAATWQCFDRLGWRPETVSRHRIPEGASVILGGGGNLIPLYRTIADALEICLQRKVARCLLLPHTIRGNESLLNRLDQRFTLCCRDAPSLEHARQHAHGARLVLADDMALGLDVAAMKERTATLRHRIAQRLDRSLWKHGSRWRAAVARQQPDKNGVLTILRSDAEKSGPGTVDASLDLMRYYLTNCRSRTGCERVTSDILDVLGKAGKIVTDRLHVALPAALLGLEVDVLDNSYGKLSAIWNTSLAVRFPKVRMVASRNVL